MYCQRCGKEVPTGATYCPSCGFGPGPSAPPGPAATGSQDPFEQALLDVKRAAKDLGDATAKLSKRVAATAGSAAKDPSGTAKKAAERVKKDIDEALTELSALLNQL